MSAQAGLQDGAAGGEGVGGGAGGGGNDEAVRTLGIDKLLIDKGFKLYHLPRAAARDHNVVQGEGFFHAACAAYQVGFQQDAFFGVVFAGEHAGDFGDHVFARHLGEEAQMPLVDADEGDAEGGDFAGGGEKRAVAAEHNDQAAFAADVVFVGYATAGEVVFAHDAARDAFAVDKDF